MNRQLKIGLIAGAVVALSIGGSKATFATKGEDEASKNQLREILERINAGDDQAFLELANFPTDLTVPFLDRLLKFSRKESSEYQRAREALASDPRFATYLGDRLTAAKDRGAVDLRSFELLSLMGTPKAQEVVAPHLFDFTRTPPNGHGITYTNAIVAALGLGRMELSDSPTSSKPESHDASDILAWQMWAIAKGFVPQSTKAHVPHWLMASGTVGAGRPRVTAPQPTVPGLPPEPSSIPEGTPPPASEPDLQEPSSDFPIISLAVLATGLVAIVLYWLRGNVR